MASVQITVPDALVPRLKAAMRATFPEHAALSDVAAFKEVTAAYWRGILADHEAVQAEKAAWQAQQAATAAAREQAEQDGAGIA